MSRILPYPLLAASLLVMWLLLNGLSIGHVVLGSIVAVGASLAMIPLQPSKPRIRRWSRIPHLVAAVFADVVRSNIAVATIVLRGRSKDIKSVFVVIPLELRDRTGLAILSCIITGTPGTAWLEYRVSNGLLLLHVLDNAQEQASVDQIKNVYEPLLREIFE